MANFTTNENCENYSPNYLATICKLGVMVPIEDSDHLMMTVVNGFTMVVSNDMHEGDIVVYFPVETRICDEFLAANNLFCTGEYQRNSNSFEVHNLLAAAISEAEQGNTEEAKELNNKAKALCGFFDKKGRVRIIKLRGVYSEGFIAGVSALEKYLPDELKNVDWESLVGTSFNTIDDNLLCWKYVPMIKVNNNPSGGQSRFKHSMKKLKRFDRIIPGMFAFHYDTVMLNNCIDRFKPDDVVTITVKVHGSSGIFGNILINRKLTVWDKVKRFFGCNIPTTEYGEVYSSRRVIKNQYINQDVSTGFYSTDIWGEVNKKISPYIEKGMTVYGEIAGYEPGSDKMIQKNHDYGCKPGQWQFMPYRIHKRNEDGSEKEYDVLEVNEWTVHLIDEHPEVVPSIMPMNVLYHGKLRDLYPDLPIDEHWHENLLERMKNDHENFLMEEIEPMCYLYKPEYENAKRLLDEAVERKASKKEIKALEKECEKWENLRAPREGIVIRKDGDPIAEAWKLKTARHYALEAKAHDEGEADIEEIS